MQPDLVEAYLWFTLASQRRRKSQKGRSGPRIVTQCHHRHGSESRSGRYAASIICAAEPPYCFLFVRGDALSFQVQNCHVERRLCGAGLGIAQRSIRAFRTEIRIHVHCSNVSGLRKFEPKLCIEITLLGGLLVRTVCFHWVALEDPIGAAVRQADYDLSVRVAIERTLANSGKLIG